MSASEHTTWGPRIFIVALFALFMFPIVGALVLNTLAPSWLPFGQVNRGQLLDPPVRMDRDLLTFTGRSVATDTGEQGTWMVVHVSDPPCQDPCQRALVSLRQARLALGKDASRVERWWLVTRDPDPRTVQWAADTHPGLKLGSFGATWPLRGDRSPLQVVDPAGYVILSYESADAASDLLKDLKRLLKISKQG